MVSERSWEWLSSIDGKVFYTPGTLFSGAVAEAAIKKIGRGSNMEQFESFATLHWPRDSPYEFCLVWIVNTFLLLPKMESRLDHSELKARFDYTSCNAYLWAYTNLPPLPFSEQSLVRTMFISQAPIKRIRFDFEYERPGGYGALEGYSLKLDNEEGTTVGVFADAFQRAMSRKRECDEFVRVRFVTTESRGPRFCVAVTAAEKEMVERAGEEGI
jgi:hypothetical protein